MNIESQVQLKPFNTLSLNSIASHYVKIQSIVDLQQALQFSKAHDLNVLLLSGGSNMMLPEHIHALVVAIDIQGIEFLSEDAESKTIKVGAGQVWHDFVLWTTTQQLYGLQNLALIPGLVGASPVQNIGAYGMEAGQAIEYVTAFDFATLKMVQIAAQECAFAYRDSLFKHALHSGQARYLITSVCFKMRHDLRDWQTTLGYGDVAQKVSEQAKGRLMTPQDVAQAIISIRQSKLPDPKVLGNAGSFFKNPVVDKTQADALKTQYDKLPCYPMTDGRVKLAAGWLIEQAGWKGARSADGHVGVYEKQALVLVNHGGGTGAQLMGFARVIADDVQSKFGVTIEPEPIVV